MSRYLCDHRAPPGLPKRCAACNPTSCTCTPSFYGVVYDPESQRTLKTKHLRALASARDARHDLKGRVAAGVVVASAGITLGDLLDRFVIAAKDGVALNKRGRPYKRSAYTDIESALRHVPESLRRKPAGKVRRGDLQHLVDTLRMSTTNRGTQMSGSRVRSVIHSIRAAYSWAAARDLVDHDPGTGLRLPAMDEKPRDRVATPAEFKRLVDAIDTKPNPADVLPFALAGYGGLRNQEIRALDWADVDSDAKALVAAEDEDARKPGGSWRVVPIVTPLMQILHRAWTAQGEPTSGKVCPSRRADNRSGKLALDMLLKRAVKTWRDADLGPINFQELRHTCATWLDHAGVTPKVAPTWMGHKTPTYQPGAAAITLRRYTHMLPGELERARDRLEVFIDARERPPSANSQLQLSLRG